MNEINVTFYFYQKLFKWLKFMKMNVCLFFNFLLLWMQSRFISAKKHLEDED